MSKKIKSVTDMMWQEAIEKTSEYFPAAFDAWCIWSRYKSQCAAYEFNKYVGQTMRAGAYGEEYFHDEQLDVDTTIPERVAAEYIARKVLSLENAPKNARLRARCPHCTATFATWAAAKLHTKYCPFGKRPRLRVTDDVSRRMTYGKELR